MLAKPLRENGQLVVRFAMVAALAVMCHQLSWTQLRFLTSECILRASAWLGMEATRVSFDTIRIKGELFQVLTSCTFIDVILPSVPLLWSFQVSVLNNVVVVMITAISLFLFNLSRLEVGHLLYASGGSWVLADGVLGGFSYFLVWIVLWERRGSWSGQPTKEWAPRA